MERLNSQVAERLAEVAIILEAQGANPFRVGAYRRAAAIVRGLDLPVDELVRSQGLDGLKQLPGIGHTLARCIHQLVVMGRLPMLERLRGESDPIKLLCTVPGIGKVTAERLYDELGVETLEELESAAHDGRLAAKLHFGEKRIAGIRDSLASRLGRIRLQTSLFDIDQPPVSQILEVDKEYRTKAAKGLLPRISPRRFNVARETWLPILHLTRGQRNYTVMFSNTARAHQLNKTADWVVIYYDGKHGERQCTVVTATHGPLVGRRIVRGREPECMEYYGPRSGHPASVTHREAA